jgi:dTDP-4-dehydrorhamnose reductase
VSAGRVVMVTGAGGRLGRWVVRAFGDGPVIAHTRQSLDLTDEAAVQMAVRAAAPAVVINCAAFNDVDGAEDRPLDALRVNAFAVRALARAAADSGARLVHYSTDFVFDGESDTPYDEADPPAPLGAYGASKLIGEWFAIDSPGAVVLRVESLFGLPEDWHGVRGSLDGIVDRLREGREVPVFTDRVVSPSYMPDIAAATRHLVDTGAPGGLYHCVNAGHATWEAVAREAARILGVEPRVRPVTLEGMPLRARRPRFCALAGGKLAAAGFGMPPWEDALRRWLTPASEPSLRTAG